MEHLSDFPTRVARGGDGAYRWRYDMKAHGNDAPMRMMLKIGLAIGAPVALVLLALTWGYDPLQAMLTSLGVLALIVLLPLLIWKLAPPDAGYRMDETQIEAWPKGRNNNIHPFKGVTNVESDRRQDRIVLRWRVTRLEVYVPPEDYDFVMEFIRVHVPEGARMG